MNKYYLLYIPLFLMTSTSYIHSIIVINKCPYPQAIHVLDGKKTLKKVILSPDQNIEIRCKIATHIKRVFPAIPNPRYPDRLMLLLHPASTGSPAEHLVSMLPIKGHAVFELKHFHTNSHNRQ